MVKIWPVSALFCALLISAALMGCDIEPHKSDAELGLNSQQAAGRRVFDNRCARCHYAYSSRSLQGPSMHGIFKKPDMPSGTPANDERAADVIRSGKSKMPGFGQVLSDQEIKDLLAYLHTLVGPQEAR